MLAYVWCLLDLQDPIQLLSWPVDEGPQLVHIPGPAIFGIPPTVGCDTPTEKEDISFLTLPWHSGQVTRALTDVTSLSNLYLQ